MATWAVVFVMLGVTVRAAQNVIQLDMAPNSVDDMYDGCKDKMSTKVQNIFLPNEKKEDKRFAGAWNRGEKYYNEKWSPDNKNSSVSPLEKEQIIAVHVYTRGEVYLDFNKAVRTGKDNYKTTFKYHTLHFFLTNAIQTLNRHRSENQRCYTTYRGVKGTMTINQGTFRFGSFTSSSMDLNIAAKFGTKTCFEIYTCFGANITRYSKKEDEREVLIPPYEEFKFIKSEKNVIKKNISCELFHTVESMKKTQSNLNCYLV